MILYYSLISAVNRTFIVNERLLSLAKPCGDLIILSMRHHLPIMINHGSRKEKDIRSRECSQVHSLWIHETVRIIIEEASRKKKDIHLYREEWISLTSARQVCSHWGCEGVRVRGENMNWIELTRDCFCIFGFICMFFICFGFLFSFYVKVFRDYMDLSKWTNLEI